MVGLALLTPTATLANDALAGMGLSGARPLGERAAG